MPPITMQIEATGTSAQAAPRIRSSQAGWRAAGSAISDACVEISTASESQNGRATVRMVSDGGTGDGGRVRRAVDAALDGAGCGARCGRARGLRRGVLRAERVD